MSNYFELKSIKPRLEDPDLETFLDQLEDRDRLFKGMTKTRNAVFHAKSRRAWRDRDIVFIQEIFQQRTKAGDPDVVGTLSVLLYDFTQRCFMGDLKIWPLRQYEADRGAGSRAARKAPLGKGVVRRVHQGADSRGSHRTLVSH